MGGIDSGCVSALNAELLLHTAAGGNLACLDRWKCLPKWAGGYANGVLGAHLGTPDLGGPGTPPDGQQPSPRYPVALPMASLG